MKHNVIFRTILHSAIILGAIFLSGCVSIPDHRGKGQSAEKPAKELVKVSGTIDFSTYEGGSLWNTLPQGNPVFFAASPRMGNREEEEEACIDRAAVQASKFIAAQAKAVFILQKTNVDVGYASDITVNYDKDLALSLREELTVEKALQDNEGTYILARLESVDMDNIPFRPAARNGKPDWTDNPPDIPGYYTAVGITQRSRFIADSMNSADDLALGDLVKQISISVKSSRSDISVDRVGTATDQIAYEEAEATVTGFYVIARWRSQDGSHFYSLAVAPKK